MHLRCRDSRLLSQANKKNKCAVVGVSGMGRYALNEAAKENLVAMCDVDDARAANAFKSFRMFRDSRISDHARQTRQGH